MFFLSVVNERSSIICYLGFIFSVYSELFKLPPCMILKYLSSVWVFWLFFFFFSREKRLIFKEICHLQCLVQEERLPLSLCFEVHTREYIS